MRLGHRRRRRRGHNRIRRRRHNVWLGNSKGHRQAACKGWSKRRRRRRKSTCRPRARNTGKVSYNRRRRRRNRGIGANRRRRHNRRHRRRSGRNPNGPALSIGRPFQAVTAAFNAKTLGDATVIVGGALGNAWLSGAVSGFLPDMLKKGPGSYVTGLASAGLLGAGIGMIAPKQAGKVFFGGVLEVVTRAVKEYVVPMLPGMSGMGDYLTRENAAEARPLGELGDYLTRQDAAESRPLGDYYGEQPIQEELAGY